MLSLLTLLGAFSGAFLSLWSKQLPSPNGFLLLALFSLLPLIRFRRWLPAALLLCSFAVMSVWSIYSAEKRMAALWPEALWREPVQAELIISSIPHRDDSTGLWRFDAQLLAYQCPQDACVSGEGGLIRLHWYAPERQLRSGQIWRLPLRLKRPRSLMNDGGFDYRRYALTRQLTAIGGVSRRADAVLLGEQGGWVGEYRRWRHAVADSLAKRWVDFPMRGLLIALALGERRDIEPHDWRLMQSTGVVHLMAISGLHIGIAAAAGWLLLSRLLSPLPAGRVIALAGGAMIAIAYAALAGFTLPTQRALVMVLAIVLSKMLNRRLSAWHGWRWALGLLLLLDPLVVLDTGFYLSFLAVAALLCYGNGRRQARLASWIGPQLAVLVALLPLTIMINGAFNPLALPANLVLIPLFSVIVVPFLLLALVLLGLGAVVGLPVMSLVDVIVTQLDAILQLSLQALRWLNEASLLPRFTMAGDALALMLLAMAAVIVLLPLPKSRIYFSAGILLAAFSTHPEKPAADEVWITVLDVGQGTSLLIQSAQQNWVYDLGRSGSPRFNSSEHNLLPLLRQRGIEQLDGLIISHADNDHYGAYRAFLSQVPVGQIWVGEALEGLSHDRWMYCRPGMVQQTPDWEMSVLHPDNASWQGNNASCVLRLAIKGGDVWLLSGDVERKAELAMLGRGENLSSDVVLAPHHGSQTSSSGDFIEATGASALIVTAAYRHHFGHPHPAVVERWQGAGTRVVNVAECGALEWRYRRGERQQTISWREQNRRWWHDGNCQW